MVFTNGAQCTDEKKYQLTLQINCDEGASKTLWNLDEQSYLDDACSPRVIMTSKSGCPVFGIPPLWRWVDNNVYLLAATLVTLGSILLHMGGKHYIPSIGLINTFGMTCFMLTFLFTMIMPQSTPQFMVWILIGFSVGVGIGLGYGSYNWPKFGLGIMGVVTGSILGVMIYTLFFSR